MAPSATQRFLEALAPLCPEDDDVAKLLECFKFRENLANQPCSIVFLGDELYAKLEALILLAVKEALILLAVNPPDVELDSYTATQHAVYVATKANEERRMDLMVDRARRITEYKVLNGSPQVKDAILRATDANKVVRMAREMAAV